MPLVSDFLCERGYCYASCQWLAMWERLLPCLLSATCYVREVLLCLLLVTCCMSERLLPCLLSATCYVREVTVMPLTSDVVCETHRYRAAKWPVQSFGKLPCFATVLNNDMACYLLPRSSLNILRPSFWFVMKYSFREFLIYSVPSSRLTVCSRIFCPSISWINIYLFFVSNFASCGDASITFFGFSCSNILFIAI
jgi:hypothetical protein